jgi:hypothetical protein
MNFTSKTLTEIVDETFVNLYRIQDRPAQVALADFITLSQTTFTVQSATEASRLSVTDVVEFDKELVLITDKSTATIPVFTCRRGQLGSVAVSHDAGSVGLLNPLHTRIEVERQVKLSVKRLSAHIPNVQTVALPLDTGGRTVTMPASTEAVFRVVYVSTVDGLPQPIDGWEFLDDATWVAGGKQLRLALGFKAGNTVQVTYRLPYVWVSDVIQLPEFATDLPALNAACVLAARREVSRLELNNIDEWDRWKVVANGQNIGQLREMWKMFYQLVDEARRAYQPPKQRNLKRYNRGWRA